MLQTLKRNAKKIRTQKVRKLRQNGSGLVGVGTDGCIIDSASYDTLLPEDAYVAKIYSKHLFNAHLHEVLSNLDPSNERYNWYHMPKQSETVFKKSFKIDMRECRKKMKKSKRDLLNMTFQKKLKPLTIDQLTKQQYRYLRESIEILHKNNISHGDLVGNVMMDSNTELPVITDWETARLDANDIDKLVDKGAFFSFFKIKK